MAEYAELARNTLLYPDNYGAGQLVHGEVEIGGEMAEKKAGIVAAKKAGVKRARRVVPGPKRVNGK